MIVFSRFPTRQVAAFLSYAAARAGLARKRTNLHGAPAAADSSIPASCRVLDSSGERGAKLIEIAAEDVGKLRAAQPGLATAPVLYYKRALAPRPFPSELTAGRAGYRRDLRKHVLRFTLEGAHDGTGTGTGTGTGLGAGTGGKRGWEGVQGVQGAEVVALTDVKANIGVKTFSGEQGEVMLELPGKLRRLYVYPRAGYWGVRRTTVIPGAVIRLARIDHSVPDGLRHFFPVQRVREGAPLPGAGVRIGLIDTGCDAQHPHLQLTHGTNLVRGESPEAWGPAKVSGDHGTHLAGIIASRAGWDASLDRLPGQGGLAPGAELYCYRVFPDDGGDATNFDIIKAIDLAVSEGCDIINLSLCEQRSDEALRASIEDARRAGVLVIAASGNNGAEVEYPAAFSSCVAVSAFGRLGTFPASAPERDDLGLASSKDAKNCFATFSNYGQEVDLCLPGVAIVSTVATGSKEDGAHAGRRVTGVADISVNAPYGVLSGTSMAAPSAAGIAARILATKPRLLSMAREASRRDELAGLLLQSCVRLGFTAEREGAGLPRPPEG